LLSYPSFQNDLNLKCPTNNSVLKQKDGTRLFTFYKILINDYALEASHQRRPVKRGVCKQMWTTSDGGVVGGGGVGHRWDVYKLIFLHFGVFVLESATFPPPPPPSMDFRIRKIFCVSETFSVRVIQSRRVRRGGYSKSKKTMLDWGGRGSKKSLFGRTSLMDDPLCKY